MTIKIRSFLFLLFLLGAISAWGQSHHALLIGIGKYPEGSGWNTIHGNNDITIVKSSLLRQGFDENSILQLIDSSATKAGILNAFENLSNNCQKGDIVYIHFSGHGQQITDLNGDEEDGFDEAWIPYDAQKEYNPNVYKGENHIIDDEINVMLKALKTRVGSEGKIVVVADACHSGSGSRAEDDDELIVRGTSARFVLPDNPYVEPYVAIKPDWLFIAACKPYQTNYEYKTADGTYYGMLSYIIASESSRFDSTDYLELLRNWSSLLLNLSRYPQDLDCEGEPNHSNSFMF